LLFDPSDIALIGGYLAGLRPDPRITVREWADTYRRLPETSARPGKFDTSVTPYLREVMERLSVHDPAQKIVVKKSSQVGFTECGNNWLGYVIDVAPSGFLYVMPTDSMMKDTSKNRIQKMIESTPSLTDKIQPARSRDKGNTLLYKEFGGGFVKMVGANSPVGLSSTAVRYVYMDEIDRYPLSVGGEGSALALAETRTITFGARKKLFLTSTPTLKGISAIDNAFEATGQRFYHVPCPFCGHFQQLVIEQLRYKPGDYSHVVYECEGCKQNIDERFKQRMLNAGKWVARFPEREHTGTIYGYFINSLYSPNGWFTWADLVQERDESLNDVPKKIAFTNTKLGECYDAVAGDKPDWEALHERAEQYTPNQPFASVIIITAGVDVQADRLEVEIVGWMEGKGSQSIDYRVIEGDTSQPGVWLELGNLFAETWVREDSQVLPLRLMGLDTGYNTEKAYEFTQAHGVTKVIPLKGRDKQETFVSAPRAVDIVKAGKKIGRVKVWNAGVSLIKSEVYGLLKLKIDKETGNVPAGYCHFPDRAPSYFRGLTAEELVLSKDSRGFDVFTWIKKYKRNEPLDCRVYARAAAYVVGIDRWDAEKWRLERYANQIETETQEPNNSHNTKKRNSFWQ
jgi:phage terminase large subunit GpA-like protein